MLIKLADDIILLSCIINGMKILYFTDTGNCLSVARYFRNPEV